jgi:hypothetical protein
MMAGVTGAAAGILGLTGISGFVFYAMVSLLSSLMLFWKMSFNSHPHFRSKSAVFDGALGVLDVSFPLSILFFLHLSSSFFIFLHLSSSTCTLISLAVLCALLDVGFSFDLSSLLFSP